MATTIEVTVPDKIMLGRNGAVGELSVNWTKVPRPVLDHIASVYFSQIFSDAANAGGRDESPAERLARAQKKLDAIYAGTVRARCEATEPADPVENEAYQIAKAALVKKAKSSPVWSSVPKDMRKKDAGVVHVGNRFSSGSANWSVGLRRRKLIDEGGLNRELLDALKRSK